MTYCVGLLLNEGMVLLSDTRTNAGLDNIATYRKMFVFEEPGERVVAILTAGSLSVTQTTMARLHEAVDDHEATSESSIMLAPTMLKVTLSTFFVILTFYHPLVSRMYWTRSAHSSSTASISLVQSS